MGYNLFAEVAVLLKGYYFCAKGAAGGDERLGSKALQDFRKHYILYRDY